MTSYNRFVRLLFWLTPILVSCDNDRLGDKSIVKEGVGVDDFEIKTLLVKEVKEKLGDNFETINHHSYSVELFYKELGTSFYYKVDSPDTVFAISFDRNFKGKTQKGLDIRQMTVADMLRIYGPTDWVLLESAQTLYAHYDSLGIYFSVKPKGPTPLEVLDNSDIDSINVKRLNAYYDSTYRTDKIIEISVGVPGTNF